MAGKMDITRNISTVSAKSETEIRYNRQGNL